MPARRIQPPTSLICAAQAPGAPKTWGPYFFTYRLTTTLGVIQYYFMDDKGLPPVSAHPKRLVDADEIQSMKDDVAALEKLGFEVSQIALKEVGKPSYRFKPPSEKPMHAWRMELEKEGFDVVSSLSAESLGFSAQRRAVQGKGWM